MILIVGASGSGKNTIARELLKRGYLWIPSYTTRAPRDGEIAGTDYYFLSDDDFQVKIHEGYFAEHAIYNGNHYGTAGKDIVEGAIKIVEPQGMKLLRNTFGITIVVYITATESVRDKRMMLRGDSPDAIIARLAVDRKAFKGLENIADIVFDNSEALTDYRLEKLSEAIDTVYFLKHNNKTVFSIHI